MPRDVRIKEHAKGRAKGRRGLPRTCKGRARRRRGGDHSRHRSGRRGRDMAGRGGSTAGRGSGGWVGDRALVMGRGNRGGDEPAGCVGV